MLSLIAMGGFVVALRERGHFYGTQEQPAVAKAVAAYVARAGLLVAVALAVAGLLAGWAFALAPWPVLVLAADAFAVFSALWLLYGVRSARRLAEQTSEPSSAAAEPLPLPHMHVVLAQMLPRIVRAGACLALAFAGPLLLATPETRGIWSAVATALLFAVGLVYRRPQADGQAAPNSGAPSI
jgi:hypothetical protein